MSEEQSWTCTRCFRVQASGTLMTFPGVVWTADGTIRLQKDGPACCPDCAETLPPGPGRVDVIMRYLGWVSRDEAAHVGHERGSSA